MIVFGWNKGQKDGADMGRKNNQKFVQIPTAKLKDRIFQPCEQYGIQFIETEESYTSKASFLDSDILPVFGAKPEGWKNLEDVYLGGYTVVLIEQKSMLTAMERQTLSEK
jgi:putative transposase